MDEYLVMADGTRVADAYVVDLGEAGIAIYAESIPTVRDAWAIFGDPEKTVVIHSYQYGEETVWEEYTEPAAIQAMPAAIQICLKREADGNV